ncbi:hypothetical protein JCM3774_006834 [Rhodotorula dairenensis]
MAPKRKSADPAGQAAQKSRKRSTPAATAGDSPSKSTRASTSSSKSKSSEASTSASTSKGKGKKQEAIYIQSDSSDADSDVVIQSPKRAAKPVDLDLASNQASKKNGKPPRKAPKARTSKFQAEDLVVLDSTSTPKDSTPAVAAKAKPTEPVPFTVGFPPFFDQYADEDAPDKMGAEGIEKLFEDMSLSMDGSYPMLLAYKVDAEPGSFGSFLRSDFERAFKAEKITSPSQLSASLQKLYDDVLDSASDPAEFRKFYAFLFPFLKSEGAKTLPAEMAIPLWSISIAQRYDLAQLFVEFAESQGSAFKAVSADVWTQLLEFCQSVEPDLTGWSEDDAWPSTIDAFVEWKKAKSA